LVAARRHAFIRAVLRPRGSNRRWSADQTRVRGGCSGGGKPKPSGEKSFCSGAIRPDAAKDRLNTAADMPAKHLAVQAAMNTHLSQSIGAGTFEGQHGMSFVISSAIAGVDMSSAIDASEAVPAMTGRDSGANAKPAIIRIASSRRMVIWRFTPAKSHRYVKIESLSD
jgi:hypothetical protein